MKSSGIVRHIDSLGRIVLPIEMRNRLEIEQGTGVEIFYEGDTIVLKKYQPGCTFCGEIGDLIEYNGKRICRECLEKIVRRAAD